MKNKMVTGAVAALLALAAVLAVLVIAAGDGHAEEPPTYTYRDIAPLTERIDELTARMDAAHDMAEAARALGYGEEHDVIRLAKSEYAAARTERDELAETLDRLLNEWEGKWDEYPAATQIYERLAGAGYSDAVICGILGNFAVETGGGTLALDPYCVYGGKWYGLAQWAKKYNPDVWGADLDGQIDYLLGNLEAQLDEWGRLYAKGFGYAEFCELTDPRDAALAFAKCYERCASGGYKRRQACAVEAWEYFGGAA